MSCQLPFVKYYKSFALTLKPPPFGHQSVAPLSMSRPTFPGLGLGISPTERTNA